MKPKDKQELEKVSSPFQLWWWALQKIRKNSCNVLRTLAAFLWRKNQAGKGYYCLTQGLHHVTEVPQCISFGRLQLSFLMWQCLLQWQTTTGSLSSNFCIETSLLPISEATQTSWYMFSCWKESGWKVEWKRAFFGRCWKMFITVKSNKLAHCRSEATYHNASSPSR